MLRIIDTTTEMIENDEIPLDLETIVIKSNSVLQVSLSDWEKAGLRIGVSIEGFGSGYFNEEAYSDKEFALKEYKQVLSEVQKGNYSIELYGQNKLKLLLKNSNS